MPSGLHFNGPILGNSGAFRGLALNNSAGRRRYAAGTTPSSQDFWTFEEDFMRYGETVASSTLWTETDIGTMTLNPSTFVRTDVANGILRISSDATDNDGIHLQYTASAGAGEFLVPAAGRIISIEYGVSHVNWDRADWFIGIAETSATLIDNAGALTSDNLIGFHNVVATTTGFDCRSAGTATNNQANTTKLFTPTLTDATQYKFGIRIDGTSACEWWFEDQLVARATIGTAFDDGMCFSFGNVMTSANADAMDIDYIRAAGTR